MSQLIHMRQRMKAVKTIQKITRAMCLVSMSMHTRMRPQRILLQDYSKNLSLWLDKFTSSDSPTVSPLVSVNNNKELIIVIGTQKGLCGVLASHLLHATTQYAHSTSYDDSIMYIGQPNSLYKNIKNISSFEEMKAFSLGSIGSVAQQLTSHLIDNKGQYESVIVISSYAKNFFSQTIKITPIIPFKPAVSSPTNEKTSAHLDYIEEQPLQEIVSTLILQTIQALLYNLLFESFMTEQAARFVAMDNATRNANNLLTTMKLNYNKLRQAKITKELTDLIGSSF